MEQIVNILVCLSVFTGKGRGYILAGSNHKLFVIGPTIVRKKIQGQQKVYYHVTFLSTSVIRMLSQPFKYSMHLYFKIPQGDIYGNMHTFYSQYSSLFNGDILDGWGGRGL